MSNTQLDSIVIPTTTNFVQQGTGSPVILIHGMAASLHDWDDLIPALTQQGYASYALDLLGHGDSPKLNERAYRIEWLLEHFMSWIDSLHLTEPAIVIGHSLGGYIALDYARRAATQTRGLILVDPFYSLSQLPALLRRTYQHPTLSGILASRLPEWIYRFAIDVTSLSIGHSNGAAYTLPERIRAQTALDYTRTAPGTYNLPNTTDDLTSHLSSISIPTLVVWGEQDQTLSPASFRKLVSVMPKAVGKTFPGGHVPHQAHAEAYNEAVLEFLQTLG